MDIQPISIAIRQQIGELHRRRHPSKGVVVEFEGFHEAVERRTRLLRALTRHQAELPKAMKRADFVARTGRRFGHIREAVVNDGAPIFTFSLNWADGRLIGVTLDGVERRTLLLSENSPAEIAEAIRAFTREQRDNDAYLALHGLRLMSETLAEHGIATPQFKQTIDTAMTTLAIRGEMLSADAAGEIVGIRRADYNETADFIWAMVNAYVRSPDVLKL